MPERDTDLPASAEQPVADPSRSTAEFRAFASRTGEADAPWSMRAPGGKVAVLAAAVLVVAVVLAVIALMVAHA